MTTVSPTHSDCPDSAWAGATRGGPRTAGAFAAVSAIFVLSALPFLDRPIDSWEWLNHAAARQVAARGIPSVDESNQPESLVLMHPPMWAHWTGLALRYLGGGVATLRAVALPVTLLTAFCLWALCRNETGLLPAVLFLTSPAALQGTLYISFCEGTFLPLAFVVFVWVWIRTASARWYRAGGILGGVFALALWSKITTSLALPPCLGAVAFCREWGSSHRWQRALWMAFRLAGMVTATGAGLFALTWVAYVLHLSSVTGLAPGDLPSSPLRYLTGEAGVGFWATLRAEAVSRLALAAARAVLYVGPAVALLAALGLTRWASRCWREKQVTPEAIAPIAAVLVSGVYLVLRSGMGSFPKDHLATLPIVCLLAVWGLRGLQPKAESFSLGLFLATAAVGTAYYAFVVGDYLLLVNHELRWIAASGASSHPVALKLAGRMLLYALPPALAAAGMLWWKGARNRFMTALAACVVASQLGLTTAQALGAYHLVHSYGTPVKDLKEAVRIVQSETGDGEPVLALPEFACAAGRPVAAGMSRSYWDDVGRLVQVLEQSDPAAVIYGLPSHTVHQMTRVLRHPEWLAALSRRYRHRSAGEYTVWIRKNQGKREAP